MYSYLLRLALKDGSTIEIRTNSTNTKKSLISLVEESNEGRVLVDVLEDVSRVLYFKRKLSI